MYKSITDIKANVKYNWNHGNCKFKPGARVRVNESVLTCNYGKSYHSKRIQNRCGVEGNVVAVSCTSDGTIRGNTWTHGRQFTRYYVQFNDGGIIGIHSHALDSVQPPVYDY